MNQTRTIFDIGMFDGADTEYYLATGHRVVAVEANPTLVEKARERFFREIGSGRLTCIHGAISTSAEPVKLILAGDDIGSSSILAHRVGAKQPLARIEVPGVCINDLIEEYGVPFYMKIDIEGMDRLCVIPLRKTLCPRFLSFEVGDDADELIAHTLAIGYTRFKIINQTSFRELANQDALADRMALWVIRRLGYAEPAKVRRAGRLFVRGHSSGPLPWVSNGRWYSGSEIRSRLRSAQNANTLRGWYDIHAAF